MRRPLRNIGIMAHIDAGKTTLTERILFNTGQLHTVGDVHKGTAEMDFRELEKKHGITISAAATSCKWKEHRITIIDTPGHVDFTIEVERSLRVLDSAIAVFSAVSGVEPQTETVWMQADKFDVPRICFVNKMDCVGANYNRCVDMIADRLGAKPLILQIPIGAESTFCGIVDLINMQAYVWHDGSHEPSIVKIPDEILADAQRYHQDLIETLVEIDEQAMEVYLDEDKKLKEEDLRKLVRKGSLEHQFTPVLCGSAYRNVGIQTLLDAIVEYCPAPQDCPDIEGHEVTTGQTIQLSASPDGPLIALAFKVQMSRYGALTYVRVYSGRMDKGINVVNATKDSKERINRIMHMYADRQVEVSEALTGDIVAVSGLKLTGSGDTLNNPQNLIRLPGLSCPAPVIEAVIEPKAAIDQEKMSLALAMIAKEDPS